MPTIDSIINKYRPFYMEIVESGALAAVLATVNIPQEWIAGLVIIKGIVKTYLLRNAVVKKDQSVNTVDFHKLYSDYLSKSPKEEDMTNNSPMSSEMNDSDIDIKTEKENPMSTQTTSERVSLSDRVDYLVSWMNDAIVKNGGKRYEPKSFANYILDVLTKSEQDIAREAVEKLTPLQKKALGLV